MILLNIIKIWLILPSAWVTIPKVVLYISRPTTKCIMPSSLTTIIAITYMDALISTNPSILGLVDLITKCNVSLWCVQLTFIWLITCVFCTTTIWIFLASTSFHFHANLIRHSKYSNSLEMINMISIGVNKFFPLIKWERIVDLTITSTLTLLVSLFFSLVISSILFLAKLKIIANFFFNILIPKKNHGLYCIFCSI